MILPIIFLRSFNLFIYIVYDFEAITLHSLFCLQLLIILLQTGYVWCYSWRYRLQNFCWGLWKHSRTWYYICFGGLLLSHLLWYCGKAIVCVNDFIYLRPFNSNDFDVFQHIYWKCLNARPGSIQARGENLFRLIQAFANSSDVLNADERSLKVTSLESTEGRAVFFDYLSLFMVCIFSTWFCSLIWFLKHGRSCLNALFYLFDFFDL